MLAVVSHDAGGAEVVSSYIRQSRIPCIFSLAGPAKKIFNRKLGEVANTELNAAIDKSDWVLCGTSWRSDLEWQAIQLANRKKKKVVAFLDHWSNYKERFTRFHELHLPDEIWVGDLEAEAIVRRVLPGMCVRLVENPYLLDVEKNLEVFLSKPRAKFSGQVVLYVCEPIREHALMQCGDETHWGYTEEDAMRYFLENINALGTGISEIKIRHHPSEEIGKYETIRAEFDLPFRMGGELSLEEEICLSDVVVGCESMALVVALLAGKRAISCVPPGGRAPALPLKNLEMLSAIVE